MLFPNTKFVAVGKTFPLETLTMRAINRMGNVLQTLAENA